MTSHQTLRMRLSSADPDLAHIIGALADTARTIAAEIAAGPVHGSLAAAVGANAGGDRQIALDVSADRAFARALAGVSVRWYASEEREDVISLQPDGRYAVAIDPLDGSSNLAVNLSVGSIFSIYPAGATGAASFLRPGREQVAAGYFIYGPATMLLLTVGESVDLFVLDPARGTFVLAEAGISIEPAAREFAINTSNYRHWNAPVRAFVEDCLAGVDGPRGRDYNMRWIASLVAEAHRIATRGGVFLYPADDRPGYEEGRLRLLYEANPIALLMERAGGAASDCYSPILDKLPAGLHERTPLVFGSCEDVARAAAYHMLPSAETAPLSGQRGLFTAAKS